MAGYPLPSWLGPAAAQGWGDLAAKGQQIALERARIQQSGINANMEAQARQKAAEQESLRQNQQLQYQQAYRNAELGLRQQSIEDQQQKFQQEVQNAANKSAAMMRISQRIANGDDPSTVYMQEGPAAGMTADAMSKLGSKSNAAFIPKTITDDAGRQYAELSPGHWKIIGSTFDQKQPKGTTDSTTTREVLNPNYTPGGKEPQYITLTNKTTRTPSGQSDNAPDVPQAAIDHLMSNPDTKDDFDEKYGEGASDQYLKAQSQQQDDDQTQADTQ